MHIPISHLIELTPEQEFYSPSDNPNAKYLKILFIRLPFSFKEVGRLHFMFLRYFIKQCRQQNGIWPLKLFIKFNNKGENLMNNDNQ